MKAIVNKKRFKQQLKMIKVIIAQNPLKRLSKRGPRRSKMQKGY
jgi:hypothetical protein